MTLLEVRDVRVELADTAADIVDGIDFAVDAGEVLGLVGETGSGKTTIATALLGHCRRGARIARGEVRVDGVEILSLSPQELRQARSRLVSYVPQDPASALNPALRVGRQLREMLEGRDSPALRAEIDQRVSEVLREVKLPPAGEILHRYPHQLSGGQQQRVVLAIAFILRPKVIVLDEPTTGLDVTTQAHVLETVRTMCRDHGVAALYVSHDLAVIGNLADHIAVAYAGRLVEVGTSEAVLNRPSHPYTRKLLTSIPMVSGRHALVPIPGQAPVPGARPPKCFFEPRCQYAAPACGREETPVVEVAPGHTVRCLRVGELAPEISRPPAQPRSYVAESDQAILSTQNVNAFYGSHQVVHDVSLELRPRECLALVGESGSGKTTLARAIIGLHPSWQGDIYYNGAALAAKAADRPSEVRREIQYIFQSPYRSLNPRRSIGDSITTPLELFFGLKRREATRRVNEALDRVALPIRLSRRYPDQLSGGERQRVAIARALVCDPTTIICDEITSSLDVSVQATIVELLEELQREAGLATLFVTHNLALVRTVADRVVVMQHGRVVEAGDVATILDTPQEPYTQALLADSPRLDGASFAGRT